jgi:hypothetical protein
LLNDEVLQSLLLGKMVCIVYSDMQKVKNFLLADIRGNICRCKVHGSRQINIVGKVWNLEQISKNTVKKTPFAMN